MQKQGGVIRQRHQNNDKAGTSTNPLKSRCFDTRSNPALDPGAPGRLRVQVTQEWMLRLSSGSSRSLPRGQPCPQVLALPLPFPILWSLGWTMQLHHNCIWCLAVDAQEGAAAEETPLRAPSRAAALLGATSHLWPLTTCQRRERSTHMI